MRRGTCVRERRARSAACLPHRADAHAFDPQCNCMPIGDTPSTLCLGEHGHLFLERKEGTQRTSASAAHMYSRDSGHDIRPPGDPSDPDPVEPITSDTQQRNGATVASSMVASGLTPSARHDSRLRRPEADGMVPTMHMVERGCQERSDRAGSHSPRRAQGAEAEAASQEANSVL